MNESHKYINCIWCSSSWASSLSYCHINCCLYFLMDHLIFLHISPFTNQNEIGILLVLMRQIPQHSNHLISTVALALGSSFLHFVHPLWNICKGLIFALYYTGIIPSLYLAIYMIPVSVLINIWVFLTTSINISSKYKRFFSGRKAVSLYLSKTHTIIII